ncbi:MAG: hypothetical protein AABW89_03710 [Nanoarchaeota archaeon]
MAKLKIEAFESNVNTVLRFRTIPSDTTLDVSVDFPAGTKWKIYSRKGRVYLSQRGSHLPENLYPLSETEDPSILRNGFYIESRNGGFVVPFSMGQRIFYFSDADSAYLPLSQAFSVWETGDHRFRCGDRLEIILSL